MKKYVIVSVADFLKRVFLCATILSVFALMPASGDVRSARARVLQKPDAPSTVRKANFRAGDILATPLVSITVRNDEIPAYLKLSLELEFGGNWTGDFLKGSLVKKLGASESLTFDNTMLLDNLGNVRWSEVSNSSTLAEHTGVSGISTLGNLKNLPEGIYTLYLTVSEITLSDPGNIDSTITNETILVGKSDPNAKVEFKVVTIGSIGEISLPGVTDKSLTFRVPEIPLYSDSVSSTRISVSGPGIPGYSESKTHAKSQGAGGLKGYPADLDEGFVTWDLSALKFRAGQTYSIDMEFFDWNNLLITSKTASVTFPPVRMTGTADLADPYRPLLSWAFAGTDYSPWVKEYRVYLNGVYKGYTTDSWYQISEALAPGSTYAWHVMPINLDGTNFPPSAAENTRSFVTPRHERLDVAILQPENNSVLFKNESYDFIGTATYYDGAAERQGGAVWKIGSEMKYGLELQYAPRNRHPSNAPLQVSLEVTDSLNLKKSSQPVALTVLAPALSILGDRSRQLDKGQPVRLEATAIDLTGVEWFVDGTSIGTGESRSVTFNETGTHSVYAEGRSAADVKGNTKTMRSANLAIAVAGKGPEVAIIQPSSAVAANAVMRRDNTVRFMAGVGNDNPISTTVWTIDGPDRSQNGARGTTLDFRPRSAGEYTLTLTATDIFRKQGQASVRVLVIEPEVTVTSPIQGQVFLANETIPVEFDAAGAESSTLYSQDAAVGTGALRYTAPGAYRIHVEAHFSLLDQDAVPVDTIVKSSSVSIEVLNPNSIELSIQHPKAGDVLMAGMTYRFDYPAIRRAVIGYHEPGSGGITGWRFEGSTGEDNAVIPSSAIGYYNRGMTFTPPAGMRGEVTARYLLDLGSNRVMVRSIPLRVISPGAQIRWNGEEGAGRVAVAGGKVPVFGSAVDAEASWALNGRPVQGWNGVIDTPGEYQIAARWTAEAIDPATWDKRTYSGVSEFLSFRVNPREPQVLFSSTPAETLLRVAAGDAVNFRAAPAAAVAMSTQTILWQVSNDRAQPGGDDIFSLSHTFTAPGPSEVRAFAVDRNGVETEVRRWDVRVSAPRIEIRSPRPGAVYALGTVPVPVLSVGDVVSCSLILDGNPVPGNFTWSTLGAGNHVLGAQGEYSVSTSSTPRTITANPVNFSVVRGAPPNFSVEGLRDGDRLIAGRQYTFRAISSGAETFTWTRSGSGMSFDGPVFLYVPVVPGEKITLRATLNGISSEKTFNVTVIDPHLRMILPDQAWFPAQAQIDLLSESRNIDRFEWSVDGQAFSGTSVRLAAGRHTLSVKGYATSVRLPDGTQGDWEFEGTSGLSASILVAERLRLSMIVISPQSPIRAGGQVTATVRVEGDQSLIEDISFFLDGERAGSGQEKSCSIRDIPAGPHRIAAVLTDTGGVRSTVETSLVAYEPNRIAIVKPAHNQVFSPDIDVEVSLEVLSGPRGGISWYLRGALIPESNVETKNLGRLAPGRYSLEARIYNSAYGFTSETVDFTVARDIALGMVPLRDTETLIDSAVDCHAQVFSGPDSNIDLTDTARFISWWVDGRDSGVRGLSYRFSASTPGEHRIQARYLKDTVTRSSPERRITVRDIAEPSIVQPLNGATVRYSPGSPVALKAGGEAAANYTWTLDGTAIAAGAETSFIPRGIEGEKRISLVASSRGRSKTRFVTVSFVPDNAPVLSLIAEPVQFSGDRLRCSASAYDPDEPSRTIDVRISLDGTELPPATNRMLGVEDIGMHTLVARAVDSTGNSTERRMELKVEPGELTVSLLSPMPWQRHPIGQPLNLKAAISSPGGGILPEGSVRWTVRYLDSPGIVSESLTGAQVTMTPRALGEMHLGAAYIDAAGRERGVGAVSVRVVPEIGEFSIVWPHGRIVNAGTPLTPSLLGVPAVLEEPVRWFLDGTVAVPQGGRLVAPNQPGPHRMVARCRSNGINLVAEQSFIVNRAPAIRITNPSNNNLVPVDTPLLLAAVVEDDQDAGTVTWKKPDGTLLGTGNPLLLTDAAPGLWQVAASTVDPYGAAGNASITFTAYAPLAAIAPVVNENMPTYLLVEGGRPFSARVQITGGELPQAIWVMSQGTSRIEKNGNEVSFTPGELAAFGNGAAWLTLTVSETRLRSDANTAPFFRRDFRIDISRTARITRVKPDSDTALHVGEEVPLQFALAGFTAPAITLAVNGQESAIPWTVSEDGFLYSAEMPADLFPREGLYEIEIKAVEGSSLASLTFNLNLYQRRQGIFVDSPPVEVDLLQAPAPEARVRYSGTIPATAFSWTTDLSSSPVASGDTLRLDASVLRPGTRTVTVQALPGSRPGPVTSFTLRALGPMQLEISPPDVAFTLRKGTPFALVARARDRDGSELPAASIRWSSHLAGPVASGGQLTAATLQNLATGEHVITVTATSGNGISVSAVRRLRILPAVRALSPPSAGSTGDAEGGEGGEEGSEEGSFDVGQQADGTSGGQRILGQGNLLQRFGIPR